MSDKPTTIKMKIDSSDVFVMGNYAFKSDKFHLPNKQSDEQKEIITMAKDGQVLPFLFIYE